MTTLEEVFGPGGLFAQRFPGYEPRPGQVDLANAAAETFREGNVLLGEAPTGTGKSISLLVPGLLEIKKNGGKLIYVTANIALQEQILTKDLPQLRELLPFPFTFEIAKGFSNFVCTDRLDDTDSEIQVGKHRGSQDLELLRELVAFSWERGDLTEFPRELPPQVRRLVTIPSEDCLGKRCPAFDACYPRAARKRFGAADVIVTNYALYFIDMAVKAAGGKGVLPQHRLLVLDEAHNAAELSRQYFGQRVSLGGLKTLLHELRATGRRAEKLGLPQDIEPRLRERAEREAERYFAELSEVRRSKAYRARLDEPEMVDGRELQAALHQAQEAYIQAAMLDGLESEAREFLRGRAESLALKRGVVQHARELDRQGWIAFIDGEPGGRLELASEPISAAEFLRDRLFKDRKKSGGPQGIVLASATLTVPAKEGVSFDYSADRLGLGNADDVEGVAEITVPSPFDFTRSALIVPRGMPDPQDPLFADAAADHLVDLCEAAGGSVLGLYTSYRVMQRGAERLRRLGKWRVLVQGEAPRTELVRRFREDRESVLLGTDSLWEGVDVQGESCVAVLIDRLPFCHFDDPVLDAIKQAEKNWFKGEYLPKAVLEFKQGCGRLIRTRQDYGVIVCLDRRIVTKGYGSKFRKALPEDVRFSERLEDVPELLARFRTRAA